MRKMAALVAAFFLLVGVNALSAAETAPKKNVFKQIASIEGRGLLNLVTCPAEVVYACKGEIKDHPKAWPLTYLPRFFMKLAVRLSSSVNDMVVLPWYVAWGEETPLTRRFDLPDYVWQKD